MEPLPNKKQIPNKAPAERNPSKARTQNAAAAMRQPYNGWAVGLSYHGSRISFIPALQMLILTASALQMRKNRGLGSCHFPAGVPPCSTACLISCHPSGVPPCHSQSHGVTADSRQGWNAMQPLPNKNKSRTKPQRGDRKNTALPLQGFPKKQKGGHRLVYTQIISYGLDDLRIILFFSLSTFRNKL